MRIQVRHATLEDLDPMLGWRGHSAASIEAITREFLGLPSGKNMIFLAFAANDLIGTVQLVREHTDADLIRNAVYLQGLEVRETFRRQGIAKQLIATLEDQARLDGRDRVTVMIEPDNGASLAFFGTLGYQVFKRSSFVWAGESLPVMCLEKKF